ncbi:MAG: hypothetical protein Kow00121_34890 [Elainellaceae cyanobacterium]
MKRTLLSKVFYSATAIASMTLISSALSPAHAASLSFSLNPFTGSDAKINVTLDDAVAGAGKVQFKVDVDKSVSLADIRGLFFNVADSVPLSGLRYTGSNVTAFSATGNVTSVGSSNNNVNGNSGSQSFDVGLEIGSEGLKGGKDDFQSTIFTLSHTSLALNLSHFANQSFGARLMSVGTAGNREGSSKLAANSPTLPTPPVQNPPVQEPVTQNPPTQNPPTQNPPAQEPPVQNPPPVVITPPPTPGPVAEIPNQPNKPTEVPEPTSALALGLAAVGGVKFLKRKKDLVV